jgi:hypothetical protein
MMSLTGISGGHEHPKPCVFGLALRLAEVISEDSKCTIFSIAALGAPAVTGSEVGEFDGWFIVAQVGGFSKGTLIRPETEQWSASAHERTELRPTANPLGMMVDAQVFPPSLVVSITPSAQSVVPSLKLPWSPSATQSRLDVHFSVHSELPVVIAVLVNVDPLSSVDRNVALVGWPSPRAPGW